MKIFKWLAGLWYARVRKIDLKILWPSCKKVANDLDQAKAAFAIHAFNDNAWLVLGNDKIYDIINKLK